MQQNPFYYHNIPQDPRIHFPSASPNLYPIQPNAASWSGNYIPGTNLIQSQGVPNVYNYGGQLPPSVPPLSTAIYGTTPTLSWAHTVPSLMPWVTQGETSVPDPIIRFTAPFPPDPCTSQTATSWELLNNLGANKTYTNMHLKRKSDIDVVEAEAPNKLCITDEKMAARFKELHISNEYSVPAEASPFALPDDSTFDSMPEKSVTNLQQLEAMLNDSTSKGGISSKSIILAPELKKLVEPEKIFARTFLDKVERPSMAVVVWQPQNKLLGNVNNNSSDSKTKEKESSDPASSLNSGNNNNNFLSQQISAICNMNSSFKIEGINELLNSASSEDVMDT